MELQAIYASDEDASDEKSVTKFSRGEKREGKTRKRICLPSFYVFPIVSTVIDKLSRGFATSIYDS